MAEITPASIALARFHRNREHFLGVLREMIESTAIPRDVKLSEVCETVRAIGIVCHQRERSDA